MRRTPTEAQLRVLSAVDACTMPDDPADGWGEVFSFFDPKDGTPPEFVMRNFDRSADACEKAGWLEVKRDEHGIAINVTPAGRKLLEEM